VAKPSRAPGRRSDLLRDGAHLAVLSAFAISQPLFDLFARAPEFFATRGSTGWEIVAFAIIVTVVPPALLLLAEVVAGLLDLRLRRALHLTFVAALVGLVALQALKDVNVLPAAALVAASLLLGAGVALAYAQAPPVRAFLTVLVPAPILFLGLFFLSPVGRLVAPSEASAPAAVAPSRMPIVVVLLDELPTTSLLDARGRIDRVRYPQLAALQRDSTWFRNATTVHDHTTSAIPAILTGRYPEKGRLPVASEHPESLFTLLGRTHRMHVSEDVTRLCSDDLCPDAGEPLGQRMASLASDLTVVYPHVLLPSGLTGGLPPITGTWKDFRGSGDGGSAVRGGSARSLDRSAVGDQYARFRQFIASIREPRGRPPLHFLHVLLPHRPWQYLPSGRRYTSSGAVPGLRDDNEWTDDEWLVRQGFQRHLLQTGLVDRLVGELVARLRAQGLYDRSLVVITADHGVSFHGGAQRRWLTEGNIEDLAPVPLIVKAPGQRRGRVDDSYVRTVDVLPTIADVLGVRIPWATDGRSALGPDAPVRRTIELSNRAGDRFALGAAAFETRRGAALARQVGLFGFGREGPGLYGIGPHLGLLGRAIRELRPVPSGASSAAVNGAAKLRAVDPGSGFVPAHVTGRVRGPAGERGHDIAIAVNGRIAAVAPSSKEGGEARFSALVPESTLRPGRNELEVLAVSVRAGRLRLESLGRI
jgi:hypothetical protein